MLRMDITHDPTLQFMGTLGRILYLTFGILVCLRSFFFYSTLWTGMKNQTFSTSKMSINGEWYCGLYNQWNIVKQCIKQ